ncbi:MAG: LptF/LptG family permease, partial [Candidatus Omnitrophica bacterium]|nr:LptF/LptG family permease [Candidatus Omnitrophota bacterium]
MRILDRYILKSVVHIFFFCLLVFFFLYIIIDVFSHLEEILRHQVSLGVLWQYYLAYLPFIFVQIAPIACLLSTLYTFGNLNRNNEIVAMRSSGLSIFQISITVIIFAMLVSIFVFWVNDKFVPQSLSLIGKVKTEMESGRTKTQEKKQEVIDNLSIYGLKNRLFFVNRFLVAKNTMEGIVILEHDEHQNLTKKIVADQGIYRDGLWRFYRTISYEFDENSQIKGEPQYFEEEIMTIPETPQEFLSQRQQPDFMTIAQLDDYIWKLSKSGATTVIRNFKVELYQRFTFPLTSIIITLLGVPFSLMIKKRATGLSSIGLSIMLGFLYYVFNAIGIALGKAGILTPFLSASLSHTLALISSL